MQRPKLRPGTARVRESRSRSVEGIEPGGQACSVLSVTDRNQPFLFDSVMGELTSTHRDIFLVVHPIFVIEPEKDTASLCQW